LGAEGATKVRFAALAFGPMLLFGCNSTPGTTALNANVPLTAAPSTLGAAPGTVVWRSPNLAEREHAVSAYYIPPATVYHGSGADFSGLDPQQVDRIAATLTSEVRTAIRKRFRVVDKPGPGAFTLELILVKVVPPQPVDIHNGPYDWSSAVIGMPDVATVSAGVMTVSGRFIDGSDGKLLVGFVSPVSPQAMGMEGGSSPADATRFADAASQQFATDLVTAMVRTREANKVTVRQ
jgi:hypothetical protein